MLYYVQMSSGELYHHGILGQKWGQRNGPPYPLGSGDHSARERKAGWKKSLTKKSIDRAVRDRVATDDKRKKGLSDKQKRLIKIGVGIAIAGLAVYGAYKLDILPKTTTIPDIDDALKQYITTKDFKEMSSFDPTKDFQFIPNNQENAQDYLASMVEKKVPLSAKIILSKEELHDAVRSSLDEVSNNYIKNAEKHVLNKEQLEMWDQSTLKRWDFMGTTFDNFRQVINPEFVSELDGYGYDESVNKSAAQKMLSLAASNIDPGRTTNCMYCTTAFDLNSRGYYVKANSRADGGLLTELFDMYKLKDDSIMHFKGKALNLKTVTEKLSYYDSGEYARGNMIVTFKSGGGHSVAWELVDNELSVMDYQVGVRYQGDNLKKFLKTISDCSTVRTDNAELIWSDQLLRAIDFAD